MGDVSALFGADRMAAAMDERNPANRSGAIQQVVERYANLMAWERRRLAAAFVANECGLICDALNGTLFADPVGIRYAGAEVADALSDLAAKWQIADVDYLRRRLGLSGYGQSYALVEAVERFWRLTAAGTPVEFRDLFNY